MLNGAGQTAFVGYLTGTGVGGSNDTGIWTEGSGSGLALVAREGSPAPGTAVGVNFSNLDTGFPPVLNNAGQIAFRGSLTGTGVSSSNDSGIWSEGGGSGLALVAREGSQAPGLDAGVNFSGFSSPVLNAAGQTAFLGLLTGTGVTDSNDTSIWSEGGGSGLVLVAREGSKAPGTESGVSFSGFNSLPLLNGAGQTAFVGTLTGTGVSNPNLRGIWSEGGGSGLALVARAGSKAPGTGAGVNFASNFDKLVLNDAGQTAFLAGLTGSGVTGSNYGGLWATDLDGLLHLIVREGDLFDVDPDPLIDDLRTIRFVGLAATNSFENDGLGTGFNDAGQLAFSLSFTDGSQGIFVATIPEPASLAKLGLAGLALRRRRGRGTAR